MRQDEAVAEPALTQRRAGTLLGWLRREGDRRIMHWQRERPSNQKLSEKTRQQAAPLVAAASALGDGSVRGGTSEHDGLEGRGEKIDLIARLDDATSRLLVRFVRHDLSEENLRLLGHRLQPWGRPVAFDTDDASLFQVNPVPGQGEQLRGQSASTQIGRALDEWGIEGIAAHSPQAKRRIERGFSPLQERLVKGLRLAGACTCEQANAYLAERFLPQWEKRLPVEAISLSKAHRPLRREHDVAAILSRAESRVLTNIYTLWSGARLRAPTKRRTAGSQGAGGRNAWRAASPYAFVIATSQSAGASL